MTRPIFTDDDTSHTIVYAPSGQGMSFLHLAEAQRRNIAYVEMHQRLVLKGNQKEQQRMRQEEKDRDEGSTPEGSA